MALSWLFPQIVKSAPETTADGGYSYFDGGLIHYDLEHTSEKYVIRQIFKANNKHTGNGRRSTAVPPYHYHPYQDELFTVKSGTLCYIVNGKEGRLYRGESMMSPAGDRHTFWCLPGADEDLDVQVTVSGPVNGPGFFDERFTHNFYGSLYLISSLRVTSD
ncbi:hypothetical protein QFC20_004974 [Naganishia adeliensis]|uniref:Uncharacterized protein n=1 Tax=Naganishia adeliensis TaxID=92952 RepID=A0ACC2VVR2_9TREE|nr:hypothetical protein QFC20_004974 [Naganishia adeliensis]